MMSCLFMGVMLFFNFKSFYFLGDCFFMDSLSNLLFCLVPFSLFCLFIFLYNYGFLEERLFYYFLFSFILFFSGFCFYFSDSFLFFVFYEIILWPMSLALCCFSKDFDKLDAMFFMLTMNLLGSVPFMFYLWLVEGSSLLLTSDYFISIYFSFVFYFMFVLLLVSKIPVFLMHFWLSKAHVEGSASCSMILASLLLKMGTFGLFKYSPLLSEANLLFMDFFFCFSIFSLLFFLLVMNRFCDLKILVAVSSLVHMGMIWPLSVLSNEMSLSASVLMMVCHGFISYFFFFLVSVVYEKSMSRGVEVSKQLESVSKSLFMLLFIFAFLNLGVPPFASFLLEVYFINIFFSVSFLLLPFLFFFVVLFSVFYLMYFISKESFGKKFSLMGSFESGFLLCQPFCFIYLIFMFPFFLF